MGSSSVAKLAAVKTQSGAAMCPPLVLLDRSLGHNSADASGAVDQQDSATSAGGQDASGSSRTQLDPEGIRQCMGGTSRAAAGGMIGEVDERGRKSMDETQQRSVREQTGGSGPIVTSSSAGASSSSSSSLREATRELQQGAAMDMGVGFRNEVQELGFKEKVIAAGGAGFLSAIMMTPLDVAKTRLQAQTSTSASVLANTASTSSRGNYPSSLASLWRVKGAAAPAAAYQLPGGNLSLASQPLQAPRLPGMLPTSYRGTMDVVIRVVREEGVLRLWRGTDASLMLVIPTVAIYMPIYESFLSALRSGPLKSNPNDSSFAHHAAAPLIAGAVSRSIACVICAPIELARTRLQATVSFVPTASGAASNISMWRVLGSLLALPTAAQSASGGPHHVYTLSHSTNSAGFAATPLMSSWRRLGVLWTGVDAQLARDVPFSAICWSVLEPLRTAILRSFHPSLDSCQEHGHSFSQVLLANSAAGFTAGAIAGALTTPLDVAKTRRQIEIGSFDSQHTSTVQTLRNVFRENGTRGLLSGLWPRTLRAGFSVGVMISSYEIVKFMLNKPSHKH